MSNGEMIVSWLQDYWSVLLNGLAAAGWLSWGVLKVLRRPPPAPTVPVPLEPVGDECGEVLRRLADPNGWREGLMDGHIAVQCDKLLVGASALHGGLAIINGYLPGWNDRERGLVQAAAGARLAAIQKAAEAERRRKGREYLSLPVPKVDFFGPETRAAVERALSGRCAQVDLTPEAAARLAELQREGAKRGTQAAG